jgi:hypothetical protein
MKIKWILMGFLLTTGMAMAVTNTPPTPVIVSCAMREGTTLMDITYRVNDPDDATVKVRALAFTNGVRSFATVIRPVTWVENTETNIGDSITTGVDHTLTWNVGADWDIDLGQLKFEIICKDSRGLLPFDWVTIPATEETEELTISLNVPTDAQVLDALFWLYADADVELVVVNGVLKGGAGSGFFEGESLASGSSLRDDHLPSLFVYKRMNLARPTVAERSLATNARAGLGTYGAYPVNRPWNEAQAFGATDPNASSSAEINKRWIKHTYADGSVTMRDRYTGLMWVYAPHALAGNSGAMNWYNAKDFCENLTYAGYSDWRLPHVFHYPRELDGVMSQLSMFSGIYAGMWDCYWSATEESGDRAHVRRANYDGILVGQKSDNYYVWPVRPGQ